MKFERTNLYNYHNEWSRYGVHLGIWKPIINKIDPVIICRYYDNFYRYHAKYHAPCSTGGINKHRHGIRTLIFKDAVQFFEK